MLIVGLNAYHADASAAIFKNGKMVAAIEEERFTRIKHWAGFPAQALQFCLQEAGATFADVDIFAIGRDPNAKLFRKAVYVAKNLGGSISALKERFSNRKQVASLKETLSAISGLPAKHFENRVRNIEHHRSHLASAFFASPFTASAIVSIDGSGDFSTTMIGVGKKNKMDVIDSIDFPHSLGIFYTAFTQLLGFPHYGDEYKVMGMAPYGEPKYVDSVSNIIKLLSDGLFRLDLNYFRKGTSGVVRYDENFIPIVAPMYSDLMIKTFGPVRKKEEELTQYHKDLAASVQKVTENTIFHILNCLHKKTGSENICLAGGVAQNSVANGKITANTGFKNVYIPSAGHDAGISMGAALYVQHAEHSIERSHISSAYTGSKFDNASIKKMLVENNISFEELADEPLFDRISDTLIAGGVAGWFTGRAEFGPRALGGRSIIADPRRNDAKEILNLKVKRRESFRPFAPSVLKEYAADFFDVNEPVPFMEKVFPVKENKRHLIPAVTHVDGSGRLQTVDKDVSPRYYALIENFRQKTGIPLLLNTSFNENEPIVNTPLEALQCFLRTNMDLLAMENILVSRINTI